MAITEAEVGSRVTVREGRYRDEPGTLVSVNEEMAVVRLDAYGLVRVWPDTPKPLDSSPTGRSARDGRDYLSCGSIANPAGYCCEHGTFVREQPQGR